MGLIQAIRGTRDIFAPEIHYWHWLETTARPILDRALYQEIRTPIFEQTDLFERGIGEATDVVGKEMYSFTDRGDRRMTLRPEGTAGVVRAYIEHNLGAMGGVQRLWYAGPMFRYERPQAGRQRQFHQLGVEVLGSADPRADVEVIALGTDILQNLGLTNLSLALNSVGDSGDRQRFREALVDYLTPLRSELDPDSQDRLDRNPLRILDSKDEKTQAIVQDGPCLTDYLSAESQRHFERVQQGLTDLGIAYTLTPTLVRGLDYYTHTAFEIQSGDLGAQATVCGGGRYDGLVAALGGPVTPAVGWAMGLERLILLLHKLAEPPRTVPQLYIVSRGEKAEPQALILAQRLRQEGLRVALDLSASAFGKQFKRADKQGAIACVVLGDGEVETGTVQLKWLASQTQQTLTLDEFWAGLAELKDRLGGHNP